MTRTYTNLANESVQVLLDTLADKNVAPDIYQKTMTKIGTLLGDAILSQISNVHCNVYLACTVEDADFLAKGMLLSLENYLKTVAFACFWNQRFSPFEIEDLKVAPILRKYQEPVSPSVNYLIIIKSIISGACVVRTNLTDLIERISPEKIFIVAPVMYIQAEEKLKNSFEEDIYKKFKFFYFAKDDIRTAEGEVIPGIGGDVYHRLGFNGQEAKNKYIPEIVKNRRSKLIKV
ncbi:hypothetical protein [Gloeocapsopsis dulcis]|uniref:Uncharacterized protein n=1 Tax=Gloeocapsopsis dulcis AAB1 = 1H9 TaxID=1433147 RepID=A0A6N8FSY5_9CHRO|nr:hypothetical protein [Gloeocapsopsis dulcis]MUL36228.1 hypothetical protein [Gloeocapsopsis dulcis AAB1 = 1H9]WNN89657.1 hypothetical protein P0S91_00720 [Gloeocapsopsis dulcis]